MHDTIGCYLDLEKSQISFSKNGMAPVFLLGKINNLFKVVRNREITHNWFMLFCFVFIR